MRYLNHKEETVKIIQRWNGSGTFQLKNQDGLSHVFSIDDDKVNDKRKELDILAANGVHEIVEYVLREWKDAIDESLIVVEDCITETDTPKSAINRAISGHCLLHDEHWISGISKALQLVDYYGISPTNFVEIIRDLYEKRVNGNSKTTTDLS